MHCIISFSLLFFISAYGDDVNDYLTSVKSDIKSIKIENIMPYYKNKKIMLEKVISSYYLSFDKSMRIIEEINGGDKVVSFRKKYSYKDNKNEIKSYCKNIIQSENLELSDVIKNICSDRVKEISEIKTEYSEDGEPILISFTLKNNNNEETYVFNSAYEMEERIIKKYNESKNILSEEKYDSKEDLLFRKVYQEKDFLYFIITYNKDGIIKEQIKKEYRPDKTLRKETLTGYSYSGNISSKKEIFYNKYLLKEEEKLYDSNDSLYKDYIFEYSLDAKGNWIREIKYERDALGNKTPVSAVKRIITY